MSENKINQIVNYLLNEAGESGRAFDVYNEDILTPSTEISILTKSRDGFNTLVQFDTGCRQKDITVGVLRQTVNANLSKLRSA